MGRRAGEHGGVLTTLTSLTLYSQAPAGPARTATVTASPLRINSTACSTGCNFPMHTVSPQLAILPSTLSAPITTPTPRLLHTHAHASN